MESIWRQIDARMKAMSDRTQAAHLMRFFKTGKGEYGEGDRFLGIKVPVTRSLVKEYRNEAHVEDVIRLTSSPYHELRLAGFLLLIEIYSRMRKAADMEGERYVVDTYLSLIERGNNWDLVDLVAPKILGEWLVKHSGERQILDELAASDGCLWHQRVAIVTTLALICAGEYTDTLRIAERLLHHPHDLIHKAVGWMLRETGKRGGMEELKSFLDRYAAEMPRTMLRYAVERLSDEKRRHYMSLRNSEGVGKFCK